MNKKLADSLSSSSENNLTRVLVPLEHASTNGMHRMGWLKYRTGEPSDSLITIRDSSTPKLRINDSNSATLFSRMILSITFLVSNPFNRKKSMRISLMLETNRRNSAKTPKTLVGRLLVMYERRLKEVSKNSKLIPAAPIRSRWFSMKMPRELLKSKMRLLSIDKLSWSQVVGEVFS